jgi:uncharacterized membrane-anchored protein
MMPFAEAPVSQFGWDLGYVIGILVVGVVAALVVTILVLAYRIGKQAPVINEALQRAYQNTLPLAALEQTIDHATVIIGGLQRGRTRLGGGS